MFHRCTIRVCLVCSIAVQLAVIVVFAAKKRAPFPQFTANFPIFHETVLVFTIFEPKWFLEVPKVSIVSFFYFHIIVVNLLVCFKLLYWKLPSRCLTFKNSSLVYSQFHLRHDWRCYLYRLLLMLFSICFCCRCSFPLYLITNLVWTNSLVRVFLHL